MAEIAFDLSALVLPPPQAPLPPPTSARSSARFEDHLGNAARTPRDGAAESSPRSPERNNDSLANSEATTDSKPVEAAERPPKTDAQQPPAGEVDDDASDARAEDAAAEAETATQPDAVTEAAAAAAGAAAAAAAQAGDKTTLSQKTPAKRRASELHEPKVEKAGGKAAKPVDENPRGKVSKPTSVALKERAAELNAKALPVAENDAPAASGSAEVTAPTDKALIGDEVKPATENTADSTKDARASAVATNGAAVDTTSKNDASPKVAAENAKTDVPVAAAQTADVAPSAEAPKSSNRARGRNDESAAHGSGQPSSDQEAPGGSATAPPDTAVQAIADVAGDGESAGKDPSSEDGKPSDHSEKNEPRVAAAPALLAARSDKGHEPNGRAEGLTESERVRFVQRVASAFRSLGDEGGEMRLRLSPPELGSLRLELTVREGVLNARLETETSTARNLLLDNLPALRDRLAEQNIKVEKFDVDVRDERRQQSGEQFADQSDPGRHGQRQRQRAFEDRAASTAVTRATRGPIKHGDSSELNIVI